MSIRTRLTALLVFVNALLFVAAGYAWYAIATLNTRMTELIDTQNHVEEAGDLSRRAQLAFKIQVQEWKNMLLRSNDVALLDKHTKGFQEESAKVKSLLTELNAWRPSRAVQDDRRQPLLEHEDLGRRYTDAFKAFRSTEEGTSRNVDEAVRGIDRAATEPRRNRKQVREHGDARRQVPEDRGTTRTC
jgi:hypothetical protein